LKPTWKPTHASDTNKRMPITNGHTRKHAHTYIHTYMHTYIHTYINTYIHIHIYTHMVRSYRLSAPNTSATSDAGLCSDSDESNCVTTRHDTSYHITTIIYSLGNTSLINQLNSSQRQAHWGQLTKPTHSQTKPPTNNHLRSSVHRFRSRALLRLPCSSSWDQCI
jgi:hypothetical protein